MEEAEVTKSYIDKYGFLTSTPSTNGFHQRRDNARLEKWQDMLSRWDFMKRSRSQKLKIRTRKGVPDCLRGKIWCDYANCSAYKANLGADLYPRFCQSETESPYDHQIKKDVYRTFPLHVYFREHLGQDSLYRVLRTYSIYNQVVGYCQGMGFVAGILLMYMSEEDVFWMLVSLFDRFRLADLYVEGMPGLYRMIYILQELGLKIAPKVFSRLEGMKLSASLYATNWLLTLFASVFKIETVLRIWDCLFFEGSKVLYRLSIGLVVLCKKEIKRCDFEETLESFKRKAKEVSPDTLLRKAFSLKITRNEIEVREKEFAAIHNPTFLRW